MASDNRISKAFADVFYAGRNKTHTESQRIVLADLGKFCSIISTGPVVHGADGHVDVYGTFVALGQQNVMRYIQGRLSVHDIDTIRLARPEPGERAETATTEDSP